MNKKDVLKFVNQYLDTQECMYMTSVYEPKKVRRGVTRTNAQLRTITNGEIIIEYDCENPMRRYYLTRLAINRLKNNGYNFVVWKAENQKSPHITIYDIKGLDKLDYKINREYKKLFLHKYATKESDVSINTKSYQPVAMENKPHFKYKTIKDITIINHNHGGLSNSIEMDLLEKARANILARERMEREVREFTNDYDNSWFIQWITNEELPKGRINNVIYKNLAILMKQGLVKDEEKVLKKLSKMYGTHPYSSIAQWKKWAKNKFFSIGEIITFCDDFGYDFGKVRRKYLDDGDSKGKQKHERSPHVIRKKNKQY